MEVRRRHHCCCVQSDDDRPTNGLTDGHCSSSSISSSSISSISSSSSSISSISSIRSRVEVESLSFIRMMTMAVSSGRRHHHRSDSSERSLNHRPMKLLFCFLCFVSSSVDADGACFRRYDHQTKACKGLLFSRPDIEAHLCCQRYGQGFAQVVLRVENRKKWYECESCNDIDQTTLRRESNGEGGGAGEGGGEEGGRGGGGGGTGEGEGSDGYEWRVEKDEDIRTEGLDVKGGRRKLDEEEEDVMVEASTDRRRLPLLLHLPSEEGRQRSTTPPPHHPSHSSEEVEDGRRSIIGNSKEMRAQQEEEEEEEAERVENVRAEEETEENEENEENEDEDEEEEEGEEEEMEKEKEGRTVPLNSLKQNKTTSTAVDWSPWSDWSPCSHSCGVGAQQRRRFCLLTSSCGEEFEERACQKLLNCPVAGGWNAWTSWTACTVSCGNGTRTRMRPCLSPPPAHGGVSCQGPSIEKELCFLPACKVDGAWSAWSLWSVCSVTCGRGEQVRTRSCDEPEPSHGGNRCNGSTEERRDCDNLLCPVDGGWSNWSKWSNCSAMCGEGVQTRSRSCDNPIADHGGQLCDGADRETMPCVTRINCPVDGNWTEWSRWDICSARPCSGQLGHRVRYRTCTNPRPMFGGRACKGRTWSRQACYNNEFCVQPVDGGWCDWVDWSSCAVSIQTRSRLCECPPPVNGGQDCPGINVEEMSCQSNEDVVNHPPTGAPPVADETLGTTQSESRDCDDDESGDGSDVACADEDEEISADHSQPTPIIHDDYKDQQKI